MSATCNKYILRVALAAAAGFVVLFLHDNVSPTHRNGLIATAEARVGRPATPMSYAGVARRTTRRAYVAGAAATGAAVTSGCYQVVDAYGRLVTQCQ